MRHQYDRNTARESNGVPTLLAAFKPLNIANCRGIVEYASCGLKRDAVLFAVGRVFRLTPGELDHS